MYKSACMCQHTLLCTCNSVVLTGGCELQAHGVRVHVGMGPNLIEDPLMLMFSGTLHQNQQRLLAQARQRKQDLHQQQQRQLQALQATPPSCQICSNRQ